MVQTNTILPIVGISNLHDVIQRVQTLEKTVVSQDKRIRELEKATVEHLLVTDGLNDDNFTIVLSDSVTKALNLSLGGVLWVTAKNGNHIFLVVGKDEELDGKNARINCVVRKYLHIDVGDIVTVDRSRQIKSAQHVAILPYADTVEGYTGDIFEEYLHGYFKTANRPLQKGTEFTVCKGAREIEFRVVAMEPDVGIVTESTYIHSEGKLQRDDCIDDP